MNEPIKPESIEKWSGLSYAERFQASIGGSARNIRHHSGQSGIRAFRAKLIWTDIAAIAASILLGLALSSRASAWDINPLIAIYGVPVAIGVLWLVCLAAQGSQDQRLIGTGTEELKRVISATLITFAVIAGISYLIRADISRAYAYISLPLGLILILAGRFLWRGWLRRNRQRGEFLSRTLVIGTKVSTAELTFRLNQEIAAGYQVVTTMKPASRDDGALDVWLARLDAEILSHSVEAIAYLPSDAAPEDTLRQLSWHLEGRELDLLIAPALMNIAGPRLSVRPVAGVPLLHLDEATLTRPQRVAKRTLDIIGSTVAIAVFSPLFLVCALSVKLSSRGPMLYRQLRIGRAGNPFTMLKFRTMVPNAEGQLLQLRQSEGIETPMFKLENDPRITPAGAFLRKWSLDELPQLLNVLGGSMSLVGPRPHPIDDVNRYELEAFRRLALKPGMTGLWQVEGRSDLSWEEALQLDLYYVETWSLSADVLLLTRTLGAVLRRTGAR